MDENAFPLIFHLPSRSLFWEEKAGAGCQASRRRCHVREVLPRRNTSSQPDRNWPRERQSSTVSTHTHTHTCARPAGAAPAVIPCFGWGFRTLLVFGPWQACGPVGSRLRGGCATVHLWVDSQLWLLLLEAQDVGGWSLWQRTSGFTSVCPSVCPS